MSEVILMGEPMVLFAAQSTGHLENVDLFRRFLAGAEVNVGIGLKRLGHSVSYVTKVGTDPFGAYVENKLNSEGLDTKIGHDRTRWTGFQLKSRVTTGDPETFYFRKNSAASGLCPNDVENIDFTGAKLLHITGIPAALSESCRSAVYRLIDRAREERLVISFDPNLRPTLWENPETMISVINDIAAKSDIVLPGKSEGRTLMGSEKPEDITSFYLRKGAKAVIVKDGSRGAFAATATGSTYCPGFPVEHVVDTVGAGDGFAVGVISGYLEGLGISDAVRRGNIIGAIQVQNESDNEGLPTRKELSAYEASHKK